MSDRPAPEPPAAEPPTDEPPTDEPPTDEPPGAPAARPGLTLPPDDGRDEVLIRLSWAGTILYTALAGLTLVAEETFKIPLALACCLFFVVGLVAFFAAYAIAVGRSRTDAIGMGGLYFLLGAAPTRVRRHLMGSFAAQIVVATVTASVGVARASGDSTNLLAFGFLTPLLGIGLAGLWGARNGVFAPHDVASRPSARKAASSPPPD